MWFHTWHLTCDIIASILTGSGFSLWVVLIKLTFENTEQTGYPVVEPHIQNELEKKYEKIAQFRQRGSGLQFQEEPVFLCYYL